MNNNNGMNCRIALLSELLQEYKKTNEDLADISASIENMLGSCYLSIYDKNLPEIQDKLNKHNNNINRTKQINDEITTAVGNWYDFIKNPAEVSRLTFPLRFLLRGSSLKKTIKSLNDELSAIVIENRFIAEQVTIWEHKLETDVILDIRGSEAYSEYEKASSRHDAIICELKYLIPSVPGLCPADITPSGIDSLIEKLRHFEAA